MRVTIIHGVTLKDLFNVRSDTIPCCDELSQSRRLIGEQLYGLYN